MPDFIQVAFVGDSREAKRTCLNTSREEPGIRSSEQKPEETGRGSALQSDKEALRTHSYHG